MVRRHRMAAQYQEGHTELQESLEKLERVYRHSCSFLFWFQKKSAVS